MTAVTKYPSRHDVSSRLSWRRSSLSPEDRTLAAVASAIAIVLFVATLAVGSPLTTATQDCAAVRNSAERLSCYDSRAQDRGRPAKGAIAPLGEK